MHTCPVLTQLWLTALTRSTLDDTTMRRAFQLLDAWRVSERC